MAPKKRNLNPSGLGRAIINQKTKDARQTRESNLYTTDVESRLQSVTQEKDLDEFLNTAQLAATDFTAEKQSITVVQSPSAGVSTAHNPFLLTDAEERSTLQRHDQNKSRLRVPRRPPWTKQMTHMQLERQERDAFLDWRRGLAQLQDEMGFLLTPFERNLEVWRQLWRVMERSHLVVQIVDARNPLRFRCEDLETYVQEVEGIEGWHRIGSGKRKTLLLINKSDLLTTAQRREWANFFDGEGIQYAFFSAANAVALQQARRDALIDEEGAGHTSKEIEKDDHAIARDTQVPSGDRFDHELEGTIHQESEGDGGSAVSEGSLAESDLDDDEFCNDLYVPLNDPNDELDPRTKVLSVLELESLFVSSAPDLSEFADANGEVPPKLIVGLVGYPNVGKSSTINSLLGEKKVSVSSTPGKTKHFQTIHLSSSIMLCDCPGLVFPQFATTAAELVCDGVLPIDQLREYTGPVALVVRRIPKMILEGIYGLSIRTKAKEEGGNGQVSAEDLLIAYAIARGFTRSGQGNPDEARAARYILKDYVNAKLLYCHPPPGIPAYEFNQKTQDAALHRLLKRKRAPVTRVTKNADTYISTSGLGQVGQSNKSRAVDESFFASGSNLSARPFLQGTARHGQQFSRPTSFPHQNIVSDDGTPMDGKPGHNLIMSTRNGRNSEVNNKKHFKGNKRIKQRSGKGYD